jgi:hypothetical protein
MVSPVSASWPAARTTLCVPAHPDFVASIRAMTRAMAVLADVALEDVEELQMAVDEAAILLLPLVDEAADRCFNADFEVEPGRLRVVLSATCRPGSSVDRTGLSWAMLSAIDADAEVQAQGDELVVAVSRSREDPRR